MNGSPIRDITNVTGIGDSRGSVTYISSFTDVSMLLYRTLTGAGAGSGMAADELLAAQQRYYDIRIAVWGVFLLTTALPLGASLALSGMKAVK